LGYNEKLQALSQRIASSVPESVEQTGWKGIRVFARLLPNWKFHHIIPILERRDHWLEMEAQAQYSLLTADLDASFV